MAADRGVRIFTVGFGTTGGETIGFEGWSMRVRLDEETLKTIANMTRGEYFYAGTAADLKKVYESLNSRFCTGKEGHGNQRAVRRRRGGRGAGFGFAFTAVVQSDFITGHFFLLNSRWPIRDPRRISVN